MKKATKQVLSFVSGLTLAAVVVGVAIGKSPSLQNEIENQLNSVLKTSRSLIDAYKKFATRSKVAVNLIKTDREAATGNEAAEKIDSQWDAVTLRED